MTRTRLVATLSLLILAFTSTSNAATREEERVADAADVLDQLLRIPEKTIPPNLLARAYAVAVIPSVIKAAFGLGEADEIVGFIYIGTPSGPIFEKERPDPSEFTTIW